MKIKKAKITQLTKEDKHGNVKYRIECGSCGKEIDIRIGRKSNWASDCPHCKKPYNVSWE